MDDPTLAVVALTGAVSAATLIYRSGNERRAQGLLARTAHTFGLQIRGLGLLGKLDGTPISLELASRDNACVTALAADIKAPSDLTLQLGSSKTSSAIGEGEFDGLFEVHVDDEERARAWFGERPMFVQTLTRLARTANDVQIVDGKLRIEALDWPTDFAEYVRYIRFLIDVSAEANLRPTSGPATVPSVDRTIGGRLRLVPARIRQFSYLLVFALIAAFVIAT